jgi:hypothetical protein
MLLAGVGRLTTCLLTAFVVLLLIWRADRKHRPNHSSGPRITHTAQHIGPDADAGRERIIQGRQQAGRAQEVYCRDGFPKKLAGRNGGGEPGDTAGQLGAVVLKFPLSVPTAGTNPLTSR